MTDQARSRLWVCDPCEMTGPKAQAERHTSLTGHDTRELSKDETEAVRELWREEGRDPFDGHYRIGPAILGRV